MDKFHSFHILFSIQRKGAYRVPRFLYMCFILLCNVSNYMQIVSEDGMDYINISSINIKEKEC